MRYVILSTLLLCCFATLFAVSTEGDEWQVYIERNEAGDEVRHHFRSQGKRHELTTKLKNGEEIQSFELDDSGETVRWQYEDTSREMQLSAVLLNNRRIHMTGRHQGKAVDRVFDINEQPWNQRFQQGLGPFIKGSETKTVFWAIGTRGKGELRITRFTARRQSPSPAPPTLLGAGFRGPFHHVKLSLHGMLSLFWSGHYWYDA